VQGVTTAGPETLESLAAELRRLRELAGAPSMNRLATLTSGLPRPLPRSTISDKLHARSAPDWAFVTSFVSACREHADQTGRRLPAELTDLSRWGATFRRAIAAAPAATVRGNRPLAAVSQSTVTSTVARSTVARSTGRHPSRSPVGNARRHRIVPRQLPPAVRHFTGRTRELDVLRNLGNQANTTNAAVISAIDGTAGVGKTAIAVHGAHLVAEHFPDGQLYVDLHGFDPSGAATQPTEVVRAFLGALGVSAEDVPGSLVAQTALYRSLLADRRMLVVLDNARDADQVRPLLPGAPGCMAVVTSRTRLTSLVATEGAHPLTLGLFDDDDARRFLELRLGADRIAAEPVAVDTIIASCARLPLAMSIVAARATANPAFPLAALADEVVDAHGGLDALNGGDAGTDVRSVFSWSVGQLSPDAARLFRLLAANPGPEIGTPAVASLVGVSAARVRPWLAELARAHLVTEYAPGRFTFHDLLRAYAAELLDTCEAGSERQAALRRVLTHYLHTAHRAELLLNPHRTPIALGPAAPGVSPEALHDYEQALEWFKREHAMVLAAIERAATTGFHAFTGQLAWTLSTFFDRSGRWHDLAATQRAALEASRRLDDRLGEARAHSGLGRAYSLLRRLVGAQAYLQRSLDIFRDLDDGQGLSCAHHDLAWVLGLQDRNREALSHAQQSLEIYRAAGDETGQARALTAVGFYHMQLGAHRRALTCCDEALTLQRRVGDRRGEAVTWKTLGAAHDRLGDANQAAVCYGHAIRMFHELGDRYYEACALSHLGDAWASAGDLDAARRSWREAFVILDEVGHAEADELRARIAAAG